MSALLAILAAVMLNSSNPQGPQVRLHLLNGRTLSGRLVSFNSRTNVFVITMAGESRGVSYLDLQSIEILREARIKEPYPNYIRP